MRVLVACVEDGPELGAVEGTQQDVRRYRRGDGRAVGDPVMVKRNLYATMVELGLPAALLPGQFRGVEVKINGRLRRSLGITRWRQQRRRVPTTEPGARALRVETTITTTVELQPWILTSPLAREIVAHEAAHVIVGHEGGHGYEWRQWCLKLGGNGEAMIAHDRVAAYTETRLKVVAVCNRCRAEIREIRRLNSRRLYKHTGCGGVAVPV